MRSTTRVPGARILDGHPGYEEQSLALPKGRSARAMGYGQQFVDAARKDGTVQRAIDRVGMRAVEIP